MLICLHGLHHHSNFFWVLRRFQIHQNPSRNGTLIKFSLLKEGLSFSSIVTSVIKSLAALLPISIAASFNYYVN